jgi:hypothetical protein
MYSGVDIRFQVALSHRPGSSSLTPHEESARSEAAAAAHVKMEDFITSFPGTGTVPVHSQAQSPLPVKRRAV